MRRVRYRFHPSEYELGENEKFYGDMEARGWRLVKRGSWLSKFVPVEPSRTQYRVEVSSPEFLDEPGLTEGQLAVFEDCGWEHAASRGFLHVFRAPEGSGAPEFYADPAQQAQPLKKVRRGIWLGLGVTAAVLAMAACLILSTRTPSQFFGGQFKRFVQIPALYAAYGIWLLWALCQAVRGAWKINRTYARLKRGEPLDHAPRGNRLLRGLLNQGLLLLAGLCLLAAAGQLTGTRSLDLPARPDGPYILLSDFGWKGERASFMGTDSSLTHTSSPLADYWETAEFLRTPEGQNVWLRQHVYRLRFPGMAEGLARALMADPVLAYEADSFQPLDVQGFDAVWAAGTELVAVRGGLAAHVQFLGWEEAGPDLSALCAALARAWADDFSPGGVK